MQLMITVEYIHLNKFICRDLKPDNLIVDKNKNLILIDFDQSINLKKLDENMAPTMDFSTIYASPELKQNQQNAKYTEKMDVYSIGMLIYFIFFNSVPEKGEDKYLFNKFSQKYSAIRKICEKCTENRRDDRPSITKVIDYFFNYFFNHDSKNESFEMTFSINKDKINPLWI